MRTILPVVCLILALVSLIMGFVLLSLPPPEPDMALHQARLSGNEEERERQEARLEQRRFKRKLLSGACFVAVGLFSTAAFVATKRKG